MAISDDPKIAFVGWNPFQFLHFQKLAARFDHPTFVLEERNKADKVFDFNSILTTPHQVLACTRKEMRALDGKFDVLVCQTQFEGIEEIRKSRIAMLQYGYAKESHNFGCWRSFADVCMTFGAYASDRMSPFCPCVAIGNPRYEEWDLPHFHKTARDAYQGQLDPRKKTILYAPTWGGLSSYKKFADAISSLSDEFNIIIKIHHNSQRAGAKFLQSVSKKFAVTCDARHDIVALLSISDLLISDYSGALFDAIYCRVPVVLLQSLTDSNLDLHSLERSRGAEIGELIHSPSQLASGVHRAFNQTALSIDSLTKLRNDLFLDPTHASMTARKVLLDLAGGCYKPTLEQLAIREEMRERNRRRNHHPTLRRIRNLLAKSVKSIQRQFGG